MFRLKGVTVMGLPSSHESLRSPASDLFSFEVHDQDKQMGQEEQHAKHDKWHGKPARVPGDDCIADRKCGNIFDSVEDDHNRVQPRFIHIQ